MWFKDRQKRREKIMKPEIRRPLIAGNWKMNIDHKEATLFMQKLAWLLEDHKYDAKVVETLLFVPFTDLRSVQTLVESDKVPVAYGGEDMSDKESGAYTGDISVNMLKALGCTYVLIGHSERRKYHHETVELILAKTKLALDQGLTPVLCVGDVSVDDTEGNPEDFTYSATQAARDIERLGVTDLSKIVIAWEPAAAIGSGSAVEPEEIAKITKLIRSKVAEVVGEAEAEKLRILYGGSVNKNLSRGIMAAEDCDGLLIGGASLDPIHFETIIRLTQADAV
jgi:triosephosphate isomerase